MPAWQLGAFPYIIFNPSAMGQKEPMAPGYVSVQAEEQEVLHYLLPGR